MPFLLAFISLHAFGVLTCCAAQGQADSITCRPGSYLTNATCLQCPVRHFCTGARAAPAVCPPNSFDLRARNSTNMNDCVCDTGFFRTDNDELLAVALAQNGLSLQDSRKTWCVLCPVGYLCNPPRNSSSTKTNVEKCPALGTTTVAGKSAAADCICRAGAYLNSMGANTSIIQGSALCTSCTKNHYCVGQSVAPSPCPGQTVSSSGASSLAGCFCLPPLVMLPTNSAEFLHRCVVQSAAAFTDSGVTVGMQHDKFDLFGIEADTLYNTFAVAPLIPCALIETGSRPQHPHFPHMS